jgi:uncharacterized protein YkwD
VGNAARAQAARPGRTMALEALSALVVACLAVCAAALPAAAVAPKPAHPSAARYESPEHALIHWLNVQRAAVGVAPVVAAHDLTVLAHRHAAAMAAADRVFSDPGVTTEVHGWLSLGEDVASGSGLKDLEKALLNPSLHHVNLRSPGFRQVGVGASARDGLLYVTLILRRPPHH